MLIMGRARTFISNEILTLSLIILLPVIYFAELYTIAKQGIETFKFWFLFTPGFTPTPAWILSLFAHGSVRHLGVNIVGLLMYGMVLEQYVARKTYLGVYVSTGLLAGLIHTNLTQNSGAGASGAIMGIVGFYSAIYLALYRPIGWNDAAENVRYVLAILGPLVIAAQYAVDYVNSGGYAHVAGGIIGILLGLVYARSQVESCVSRTTESAREAPFRTALLILVLSETAVIAYLLIATPEDPATSTAVQAGATIILVVITIWYADHTRRSADLFRRELELETQRNHADTLQIRTQKWLDNLPEVSQTDIPLFSDVDTNDSFAIPEILRGDPYFEDLMENHATDLGDRVERIESKYTEFREIRQDFIQSIDIEPLVPHKRLIEVLEENYALWWFERVMLLERTENDKDDLQLALESAFVDASYEEDDNIYLVGDEDQDRRRPILVYYYQRSTSNSRRDSYWNKIWAGIPKDHIRDIESHPHYDEAVRASELLDELECEIEQLEKRLIEYNEAPRFDGECDLILAID